MSDSREKRRLNAGSFVINNGAVLRTINILRTKYNKLNVVGSTLRGNVMTESEFLDSINFLAEEGYIHLRTIVSKDTAEFADHNFEELEAKLTGKGIRLLAGGIDDNMIEV